MKCCIISALYPPHVVGGAEKVTAKLAAGLVRAGHSVVVITLHNKPDPHTEYIDGVKVYYLPIDNIYWPYGLSAKPSVIERLIWHCVDMWNFKAASRVGKILDEEQPDILNTNNLAGFSVAVWAQAKRRGIRIIHTLHDYALLCPSSTLYKNGKICETRCAACVAMSQTKYIASGLVDQLVGVSKFVAERHEQAGYFPNAKQQVIRNICELSGAQDKKHTETNREFTFGFIGRVEEEKGVEILLQAAVFLPATGWRLLIAGRGRDDYVAQLKSKYPQSNIQWLGFTKAEEFYTQIDLLIVPSLWPEPLPGVIAEAGIRSIPVVISNMGGMPEYLDMGLSGEVVPAGDVERLADVMSKAISGRGVMLNAPTDVSRLTGLFDAKTIVEAYTKVYTTDG